jgi:hypothetical protein
MSKVVIVFSQTFRAEARRRIQKHERNDENFNQKNAVAFKSAPIPRGAGVTAIGGVLERMQVVFITWMGDSSISLSLY